MNPNFREYIEAHFGTNEASLGREIRLSGECPFCGKDRTDLKLFISTRTGKGICHHCGRGFNPVQFLAAHARCSSAEAMKILGGGQVSGFVRGDGPATPKDNSVWFPETVPLTAEALGYLRDRKISLQAIRHFGLTSCTTNTMANGRMVRTASRAIIPIRDVSGNVAAWQGRDITGTQKPKYLFPDNFRGREYLFNIHAIPDNPPYIIVCEGVMDVIGWWQAGFKNAVATFGKKISTEQLAMLRKKAPKVTLMAWDADAHWSRHAFCEDNVDLLHIRMIDLKGMDADEMAPNDLLQAFKASSVPSWDAKIMGGLSKL